LSRKIKYLISSLIGVSLLVFAGWFLTSAYLYSLTHETRFWQQSETVTSCQKINATTVRLSGTIGEIMQDCALALLTADIDTVIVRSGGGEVYAGRAIGYKIGDRPRTLIVDKICLSSCGNYFVPAAAQVRLNPGAVIGLHGTPDPQMLGVAGLEAHLAELQKNKSASALGAERSLNKRRDKEGKQLVEEAKFASRFSVPKGWRLYRDIGDSPEGWVKHFVAGSDADVTPDKFLIVEQPMLASCLPHIKFSDYQAGLEDSVFNRPLRWHGLNHVMGAYRSRGLTCLPPRAFDITP